MAEHQRSQPALSPVAPSSSPLTPMGTCAGNNGLSTCIRALAASTLAGTPGNRAHMGLLSKLDVEFVSKCEVCGARVAINTQWH
jgi:hypothetical protein